MIILRKVNFGLGHVSSSRLLSHSSNQLKYKPFSHTIFRGSATLSSSSSSSSSSPSSPSCVPFRRRISQPIPSTHPYLFGSSDEVTPGISRKEYARRRRALWDRLPDNSIAIFPANPERYMSEDIPYPYHHNTNLFYLTGMQEPGAVYVLEKVTRNHTGEEEFGLQRGMETDEKSSHMLFVRPRNPGRELWDGPRCGLDGAMHHFGFSNSFDVKKIAEKLKSSAGLAKHIFFDINLDIKFTNQLVRSGPPFNQEQFINHIIPACRPISEQRLIKSPAEIAQMSRSCEIASESMNETIARTRPGISEKQIAATFEYGCLSRGAQRLSFPPVVASGSNANTLHYLCNDQTIDDGLMVLMDAGCELNGYASDISRSWPANGKFTPAQRALYELCLYVNQECIQASVVDPKMSTSLDSIHELSVMLIAQGLCDLGLFKDTTIRPQQVVDRGLYFKYFPHAIGHYLGLDVHDTHSLEKSIPLQDGMVITIEPGLYIPKDDMSIPEEFRGIGIRTEDNVWITKDGPVNLTKSCIKNTQDIEHLAKG